MEAELIATSPPGAERNSPYVLSVPQRLCASVLSQKFPHHSRRLNARELGVEPLELERQPLVVET